MKLALSTSECYYLNERILIYFYSDKDPWVHFKQYFIITQFIAFGWLAPRSAFMSVPRNFVGGV